MAYRVTNGAGTAFNTAANWDEGVNTPSIHASTNITVTSGGITSAVFTAPNLVNACTGVLVPVAAKGTAGNIIAQLQHDIGAGFVDCALATSTIAITSLTASTHVFFKFGTPFVFATTTAGKYRVKLKTSGASGTTSIAADSGAANFAYIVFQNVNTVPTTADDIFVVSPNQGAALTIDLDSSPSIGSGGNTAVPTFRSWQNAIVLANSGQLAWPTGTSRTITCKGNVLVQSGGWLQMGQTSAKIAAGVTARLQFDQNGTTTNYGLVQLVGGKVTMQGADKTFKKTTLSSGVGTAASPFVSTDSVDWSVGDELVFVPVSNNAANYDETEKRFIITKNSATSYVLSATSGGAEAAFTYSHTAGTVFNLTRQALVDTTNIAHAWYMDLNETVTIGDLDFDGCRLETFGGSTTGKTTLTFSNLSTELFTADDIVFYRGLGSGVLFGNNNDVRTYTWLIFYDFNSTGVAGSFQMNSLRNKNLTNCYCIDSLTRGFYLLAASTVVMTDCAAWACGRTTSAAGAFIFQNASNVFLDRCEAHANRGYAIEASSVAELSGADCLFGSKGENKAADFSVIADTFNTIFFENTLVSSPTKIAGYTSASDGSEIAFQRFGQTADDHRWYTPYGIATSTGAGLSDTNVRTASSLALRIAPENNTHGFVWDFKVIARASSYSNILGFIQKNATFGTDDVIVDFYLPGLTPGTDTPSATVTMADDTTWNVFNLAASYTGTVPLYSTVRVTAKSSTAGAYVYIDDLYNGTNVITAMDTWSKGKPSEIMFEQLGDASAVWAVLTSTLTTSGTIGNLLSTAAKLIFYLVGR